MPPVPVLPQPRNDVISLLPAVALFVLFFVLVSHLPPRLTRRERLWIRIAELEARMRDLRDEQGEAAGELGRLRAKLEEEDQ